MAAEDVSPPQSDRFQSNTGGGSGRERIHPSTEYLQCPSPNSPYDRHGYTYKPLSKGLSAEESEFRLICLDKTAPPENPNSCIRGALKTFKRADVLKLRVHYWALSYTWDSEDETPSQDWHDRDRPIIIDDCVHRVQVNLYDGLCTLLKWLAFESDNTYLWIDAICINQQDNEEKSWQVNMMGWIYSRAKLVVVWLGPAHSDTVERIKQLLRRVREVIIPLRDEGWSQGKGIFEYLNEDIGRLVELQLPSPYDPCWKALTAFVDRRWWSRVWVVQEVALASTIGFLCGDVLMLEHEISDIDVTLEVYRSIGKGRVWPMDEGAPFSGLPMRNTLQCRHSFRRHVINNVKLCDPTFRALIQGSTDNLSAPAFLLHLLDETVGHKAKKECDKVFGLIGLLRSYAKDQGDIFEANYDDCDGAVVFKAATKYIITHTSWLGILTLIGKQMYRTTKGLPSYVPDPASKYRIPHPGRGTPETLPLLVALANNAPLKGIPGFQGDLLMVYGMQVGTLEAVGEKLLPFTKEPIAFTTGAGIFAGCAKRYCYTSNQSRYDALWRTLLKDDPDVEHLPMGDSLCYYWIKKLADFFQEQTQPYTIEAFLTQYPAFKEVFASSELMTDLSRRLAVNLPSQAGSQDARDYRSTPFYAELLEKSKLFHESFHWNTIGTYGCLCRTSNGHLGTVSSDAKIGDSVWILARAPWPFVLRKVEQYESEKRAQEGQAERYRFVSPAHLHGYHTASGGRILHDLLSDLEKGRRHWESIAIE